MLRTLLPTTALAAIAIAAPAQAAQAPVSTTYTTVGESAFVVPPGVHRVDVSLTGARGGNSWMSRDGVGGRGATVTGSLAVQPGMKLYAEVGGPGDDSRGGSSWVERGGANGGGSGAAGGGGASDIRTEPAAAANSLASRLAVAGGGGGIGYAVSGAIDGGDAGARGVDPSGGQAGGHPGTQSAGGAGGTKVGNGIDGLPGALGIGGDAPLINFVGGGGGGGYYGGGAGAGMGPCNPCNLNGSGGGGSSLVPAGGTSGLADRTAPAQVTISYEPAQVSASATSLQFPKTQAGEVSTAVRVKLANPAASTDLHVDALALESDDFILGGSTCPHVLAPGEDCTATIRFAPAAAGARTATLKVRSNAAPLQIALAGEGKAALAAPAPIAGAPGAAGATGATGPAGTNALVAAGKPAKKKVARVTCFAKRCTVTGAPNGRAKLVRKGRVYAAGKLPAKLRTRRAVLPGRYTLKIGRAKYRAVVR